MEREKIMSSKKKICLGIIFLLAILVITLIGQIYTPYDPNRTQLSASLVSPCKEFIFGTDKLGRDIFSRLLAGMANTVFAAIIVNIFSFIIGAFLGILSGYTGGRLEKLIMVFTTLLQAFPQFVLIVTLAGIMGSSLKNSIIALIIVSWIPYARVSRSLVISIKNSDYIKSAYMCGANQLTIFIKYILPNISGPLLVTAMIDIGNVILSLAALSYLGLGAAKPAIEWGSMMSEAKQTMLYAPWSIAFPGIAIFIVVFVFNFLGEGIAEALNKSR